MQHWSIEEGAFKFVNIVLNAKNVKTREWALAALSSLVRGENLEAKRNFLSIDGLEFLLKVLTIEDSSIKMKGKALSMIRDFVYVIFSSSFSLLTPFSISAPIDFI